MLLTFDTEIDMCAAEQVMLRATIQELLNAGWKLDAFADSEEEVTVSTIEEVIKHIAGIEDYFHIFFIRGEGEYIRYGWISYIPGNGVDCISDYSVSIFDFPKHVYEKVSRFF